MNFFGRISGFRVQTLKLTKTCVTPTTTLSECRLAFSTLPLCRQTISTTDFLKPTPIVDTSPLVAGLKHVANPHRRCKHCYAVVQVQRRFQQFASFSNFQSMKCRIEILMMHTFQNLRLVQFKNSFHIQTKVVTCFIETEINSPFIHSFIILINFAFSRLMLFFHF